MSAAAAALLSRLVLCRPKDALAQFIAGHCLLYVYGGALLYQCQCQHSRLVVVLQFIAANLDECAAELYSSCCTRLGSSCTGQLFGNLSHSHLLALANNNASQVGATGEIYDEDSHLSSPM